MAVPGLDHAREILAGYELPDGIVVHSEGVRRVAAELVVVDARTPTRGVVASALRRRFGNDYQVVEAKSAEEGQAELQRLHEAGLDVAIIAASVALRIHPNTLTLIGVLINVAAAVALGRPHRLAGDGRVVRGVDVVQPHGVARASNDT